MLQIVGQCVPVPLVMPEILWIGVTKVGIRSLIFEILQITQFNCVPYLLDVNECLDNPCGQVQFYDFKFLTSARIKKII